MFYYAVLGAPLTLGLAFITWSWNRPAASPVAIPVTAVVFLVARFPAAHGAFPGVPAKLRVNVPLTHARRQIPSEQVAAHSFTTLSMSVESLIACATPADRPWS